MYCFMITTVPLAFCWAHDVNLQYACQYKSIRVSMS